MSDCTLLNPRRHPVPSVRVVGTFECHTRLRIDWAAATLLRLLIEEAEAPPGCTATSINNQSNARNHVLSSCCYSFGAAYLYYNFWAKCVDGKGDCTVFSRGHCTLHERYRLDLLGWKPPCYFVGSLGLQSKMSPDPKNELLPQLKYLHRIESLRKFP